MRFYMYVCLPCPGCPSPQCVWERLQHPHNQEKEWWKQKNNTKRDAYWAAVKGFRTRRCAPRLYVFTLLFEMLSGVVGQVQLEVVWSASRATDRQDERQQCCKLGVALWKDAALMCWIEVLGAAAQFTSELGCFCAIAPFLSIWLNCAKLRDQIVQSLWTVTRNIKKTKQWIELNPRQVSTLFWWPARLPAVNRISIKPESTDIPELAAVIVVCLLIVLLWSSLANFSDTSGEILEAQPGLRLRANPCVLFSLSGSSFNFHPNFSFSLRFVLTQVLLPAPVCDSSVSRAKCLRITQTWVKNETLRAWRHPKNTNYSLNITNSRN